MSARLGPEQGGKKHIYYFNSSDKIGAIRNIQQGSDTWPVIWAVNSLIMAFSLLSCGLWSEVAWYAAAAKSGGVWALSEQLGR